AAHPPRPAPDCQRRERAVSPPGQPERPDPPTAGSPGRLDGGRTVRRPGGGADRLRRPARSKEPPAPTPGRLAMKPLIWKECLEHFKWVGLPALLILLPMVLSGGPGEPMFGTGATFFLALIAGGFGAVLGFLQVYFESRGDQRALLLHRPLSRSRIFLAK